MKKLIILLTTFLLAACSTTTPAPQNMGISFSDLGTIPLDVANIEIIDQYNAPLAAPNIEHLMPISPAEALKKWARERLQAAGSQGTARFIIKDAKVTERLLPRKNETFSDKVALEQDKAYDASATAVLEIYQGGPSPLAAIKVNGTYYKTVPQGATLNQRSFAWFQMVENMVRNMDKEFERQIHQYMKDFVF